MRIVMNHLMRHLTSHLMSKSFSYDGDDDGGDDGNVGADDDGWNGDWFLSPSPQGESGRTAYF